MPKYAPGTLVIAHLPRKRILGVILDTIDDDWYKVRGTLGRPIILMTGEHLGPLGYIRYDLRATDLQPIPAAQQHLNPGMLRELYNLDSERTP